MAETFGSSLVHIGGDELKLPGDGRDALKCGRCGISPNLNAVVEYWNFLQQEAPSGIKLAIWGDQLLPASELPAGLRGHNCDGCGPEHLAKLDRRIHIYDWQYGVTSPEASLKFLRQAGHATFIAGAGSESLQNPFVHSESCRRGAAMGALHTTWASPDPRDLPLEGVAAAALAHAGESYDPEKTPQRTARLASWMLQELMIY